MNVSKNAEYAELFQYVSDEERKLYYALHHEDLNALIHEITSAVFLNIKSIDPGAWYRLLDNYKQIRSSPEMKTFEASLLTFLNSFKEFIATPAVLEVFTDYLENNKTGFANPVLALSGMLLDWLFNNSKSIIQLLILWTQANKGNLPRLMQMRDDIVSIAIRLDKRSILDTIKANRIDDIKANNQTSNQ
jgi:hypothetical protein